MKASKAHQQGLFNNCNMTPVTDGYLISLEDRLHNLSGSFIITKTLEIKEDTDMAAPGSAPSSQPISSKRSKK